MPKDSDFWTVSPPFLIVYTLSSESGSAGSGLFHNELSNSKKSNSHEANTQRTVWMDAQPPTDSRNDAHICILDFT